MYSYIYIDIDMYVYIFSVMCAGKVFVHICIYTHGGFDPTIHAVEYDPFIKGYIALCN